MKKRLFVLIWMLLLLTGSALAEEDYVVSYSLPEGGVECHISNAYTLQAPEGLEAMYSLMSHTDRIGDVYLIVMPHGHAILSISCTPMEKAGTAEQLCSLWQTAAGSISGYVDSINADPSCATVEDKWGYPALCVNTQVVVGGDTRLALDARGWAFYRGKDLMELWAVSPTDTYYLQKPEAREQYQADAEAIQTMLDTMVFSFDAENLSAEGKPVWDGEREPYTDPSGVFSVDCPAGTMALPMDASEEAFAKAREAFLAVNPAGAKVFDEWVVDAQNVRQEGEGGCTLLLMPEQKGALQVSWQTAGAFTQITTEQIHQLAGVFREQMSERYGLAMMLDSGWKSIDGNRCAQLDYWVRCDGIDMALTIYSAMRADGLFIDVEWFGLSDVDVGLMQKQVELMLNTLRFTSPGTQV